MIDTHVIELVIKSILHLFDCSGLWTFLGLEIPASMNRHGANDPVDVNNDVAIPGQFDQQLNDDDVFMYEYESDPEPEFDLQSNDDYTYHDGDVAMHEFDQQSDDYDAQFDDDINMNESN